MRENLVFDEFDKLIFYVAVGFAALLGVIAIFLERFLPAEGASWSAILGVFLSLIYETIPILILFMLSYLFLRQINRLREAKEREEFAQLIANKLDSRGSGPALRERKEIIPFAEQLEHATEVCVVAVSALVLSINIRTLRDKIAKGCKFRVLLLNPRSQGLESWNNLTGFSATASEIETTIRYLSDNCTLQACEVRLLDLYLPYSMIATDLDEDDGTILVEFFTYKKTAADRPHILLQPEIYPFWYQNYKQQFEQAWDDATVYPFEAQD